MSACLRAHEEFPDREGKRRERERWRKREREREGERKRERETFRHGGGAKVPTKTDLPVIESRRTLIEFVVRGAFRSINAPLAAV